MIGLIESLVIIIAISQLMARRASRYLWVAICSHWAGPYSCQ
jgi:hypothetical protein